MSVKPELAFDVCWEVYRGAREVMEAKRGIARAEHGDGDEVCVAAGCAAEDERLGGGFCAGGGIGAGGRRIALRGW